jgi:hypothetical protein
MKITLSKAQWNFIGEKTGWLRKQAGEDWVVTDSVIAIVNDVIDEIRMRGGSASETSTNTIKAEALVLDSTHAIPIKIQLYEGTYYPGKVLINATFSDKYPVPVKERPSFDAKEIVDAIVDGFMTLVNFSNKENKPKT